MRPGSPRRGRGFTYFGLLLAIASAAGALSGGAWLLANDLRRDKELDLLFAGDEIRRAIEAYHARNGSGVDPYPRTLEALLRDPHQPTVVRHLRRVRRDPMRDPGGEPPPADTGGWVLIRDVRGQVVGVHSSSTREPLKRSGFPRPYEGFAQARSYADWKFIATGALVAPPPAPAGAGSFIPSPLAPNGPLVPSSRGVPSAPPPAAPAAAVAPAAPAPANAAPSPSAAPPPADTLPPEPPVPPPPSPAAPSASPAPGATAPAPGPSSAPAGVPPPPPGAPPPPPGATAAPAVPPSFQGDGPQPFQLRSF